MPNRKFRRLLGVLAGSGGGGAQPALRQVATRSYIANVASGSNAYSNSVTVHTATEALTSWQLKYPAWFSPGTSESNAAGTLAYAVGVEYPNGTYTQIKWGGASTKTVTAGQDDTGLSDAINVAIPAGATFKLHPYVIANGGTAIASGLPVTQATQSTVWTSQGEAAEFSATLLTDKSMGGTVTDGGTGAAIYPLAIVQMTTNAAFGLPGDSRTVGTGMTPDANGAQGQITPSLGSAAGWINLGISSAAISDFNRFGAKRAALLNAYCSHIINGHGAQDLKNAVGRTPAQVQGDIFIMAKRFPGKAIFQATLSPLGVSSTDAWTTVANQTMDAGATQIPTVNTAIRATPAPLAGYIDIAAQITDSGVNYKWKVDAGPTAVTGDGLHCNLNGYVNDIQASGVVNATTLKAIQPVAQWSLLSLAVARPVLWVDFSNNACAPVGGTPFAAGGPYSWTGSGVYAATGWQGTQPAYTFNGSSNQLLGDATYTKPITNGAAGVTIALLFTLNSLPASTRNPVTISVGGSNNERAAFSIDPTGKPGLVVRRLDADAAVTAASASALSTATPVLSLLVADPSVSGVASLYINGGSTPVATGNFLSTGNFPATSSNNVAFATSSSLFTAMTARDLVICDSALSVANRQKLEGDMAWRAGVASLVLPPSHPYYNAAPTS